MNDRAEDDADRPPAAPAARSGVGTPQGR
ncbi:Hypothetical protein AAM4_0232, partial [Actinomyces succiniciruminis]